MSEKQHQEWKKDLEELHKLQAKNKKLREEKEKLTGELLLIDNYCRVNDIDLEQILKDIGE